MSTLVSPSAHPLAIAMWDFSWLERRWSGGGYENCSQALDELVDRGYDVVRIDAYPHLIWDGRPEYDVTPVWDQHDWGSPTPVRVRPLPDLLAFLELARERGLLVSFSSWFRADTTDVRGRIATPELLAETWATTLGHISAAGLIDTIWFVDLCNEWAQPMWAPFVYSGGGAAALDRRSESFRNWTAVALRGVRSRFPEMPLCFSYIDQFETWADQDVSDFDLLELHTWMVQGSSPSFYDELGYDIVAASFDPEQYEILTRASALYRSDEALWKQQLAIEIARVAAWSEASDLPLVTTESWAVVCWKDGEGLDWEWIKELCAFGVAAALQTGRWAALSTSNFCGPQFRGMWGDIEWHRALTRSIHESRPMYPPNPDHGAVVNEKKETHHEKK